MHIYTSVSLQTCLVSLYRMIFSNDNMYGIIKLNPAMTTLACATLSGLHIKIIAQLLILLGWMFMYVCIKEPVPMTLCHKIEVSFRDDFYNYATWD